MNTNQITTNASAATTAQDTVILCEDRGDYLAGLRADGEVMGGDIEHALRYTPAEASEMIASLGRGFSAEPAAAPDAQPVTLEELFGGGPELPVTHWMERYAAMSAERDALRMALERILSKVWFQKRQPDDLSFNVNSLRKDAEAALANARSK